MVRQVLQYAEDVSIENKVLEEEVIEKDNYDGRSAFILHLSTVAKTGLERFCQRYQDIYCGRCLEKHCFYRLMVKS